MRSVQESFLSGRRAKDKSYVISMIPRYRSTRRLNFLTQREARILRAIAETLFPADDNGMPSVDEAEIIEYMDDLLVHLPRREALLIRGLLNLIEFQSLALSASSRRLFSQASVEDRLANLAGWESSRFPQRRNIFTAIRTLLLWAYADSQSMEKVIGMREPSRQPPPPVPLRPTGSETASSITWALRLAATGTDR